MKGNAKRSLAIFTLISALSFGSEYSSYSVQPWPLSRKLDQGTILSVLQAKDMTLWIATLAGIDHFDGASLSSYRPHHAGKGHIESSNIIKVLESEAGGIFAATVDSGLLKYDDELNRFESIDKLFNVQLPVGRLSAAYSTTSGEIVVGYETGEISRLSDLNKNLLNGKLPDNERVTGFSESSQGSFFVSTHSGSLYRYDESKTDYISISINAECRKFISGIDEITAISNSEIWVGTRGNGLILLNTENGTCDFPKSSRSIEERLGSADIREIFYDAETELTWVASDQGLYQLDGHLNVLHIESGNSHIQNDEVTSIARGNDDLYWIGTYTGLSYLTPSAFQNYDELIDSRLQSVVSINNFIGDRTLIATYNGLIVAESNTTAFADFFSLYSNSNLSSRKIMTVFSTTKGLWLGYRSSGLQYFDFHHPEQTKKWRTDTNPKLSSDSVSAILVSRNDTVLVGTFGGGINVIDQLGNTEVYSVGNDRVIMLYEISDGTMFVGTESGLFTLMT